MEAEVVRLVIDLFHGDSKACGTVCTLFTNIISCTHNANYLFNLR